MSVRLAVVGHVDHGKSTLIGRLMTDTGQVPVEKKTRVEEFCQQKGTKYEYAFLLDALEEEQAQGITIDVTEIPWVYRDKAFAFVDTPGHREFLKKMVGGASHVDAAILMIDAGEGVVETLCRQMQLLDVLGVEQKIVLINKMDVVGWREDEFRRIVRQLRSHLQDGLFVEAIPISAWHGENLFHSSARMPWYGGITLADWLSQIQVTKARGAEQTRFQIQDVYQKDDEPVYVGRLESGRLYPGQRLEFSSEAGRSEVSSVSGPQGTMDSAQAGDALALRLKTSLKLRRGLWGFEPERPPMKTLAAAGDIFWLEQDPLRLGERVKIRMGTTAHSAVVEHIIDELDEITWRRLPGGASLRLIGRVLFRFDEPVVLDTFRDNSVTSRFVVIRERLVAGGGRWSHTLETLERKQSSGRVLWFTGLSGAGKTTLTLSLQKRLEARGVSVFVLDGDVVRSTFCRDLGFSMEDRLENIRRSAEAAKKAADSGNTVLAAFISPLASQRRVAREIIGDERFIEIFVDCPLSICMERDVKGLYAKARRGEIANMTGMGSDFEAPLTPDIHLLTHQQSVEQIIDRLDEFLKEPIC